MSKMNLSCSSRMIKYIMFGFNLFFVISGIILIAVGATVKTIYTEYEDFLDNKYFTLPNMLIATGAFIFFVSFFGCCGAFKESWIMLGIFSILLCIIFIFEFASGIAGYVLRDKTAAYLEETLTTNLEFYTEHSKIWDLIQETFECCGVNSYDDWKKAFPNDPYGLPLSCCPKKAGTVSVFNCNRWNASGDVTTTASTTISPTETMSSTETTPPETPGNKMKVMQKRDVGLLNDVPETTSPSVFSTPDGKTTNPPYNVGCLTEFGNYIKKHAVQIGGCALGLAIIQIVSIVLSCHLVRQLKNGYYST